MTSRLPTLFVPHGAGPCFFMDWQPAGTWDRMEAWLRSVADVAGEKARALLVISGHWEEPRFTVTSRDKPTLLFDYSGFPEHTYRLTWPAPGAPALAARIRELLSSAGFESGSDAERGLDHGVFIPMKVAFPDADIPVVQLSLREGLDPAVHLAAGRALAPLRDEGVLIIGSGMSFHNMRRLRTGGPQIDPDSRRFDDWLAETVALPPADREARLMRWSDAPGGRASHPQEEHLLPLHVVAGAAAGDSGERVFRDEVMGSVQSAFRFGAPAGAPHLERLLDDALAATFPASDPVSTLAGDEKP
jgi:aromatic ring-opening dioxygenase catalytic subunit (LigB family)